MEEEELGYDQPAVQNQTHHAELQKCMASEDNFRARTHTHTQTHTHTYVRKHAHTRTYSQTRKHSSELRNTHLDWSPRQKLGSGAPLPYAQGLA